jgi:hypothetical protein
MLKVARSLSAKFLVLFTALLAFSVSCSLLRAKPALTWHLILQLNVSPPLPQNFLTDAAEILKLRLDHLNLTDIFVK